MYVVLVTRLTSRTPTAMVGPFGSLSAAHQWVEAWSTDGCDGTATPHTHAAAIMPLQSPLPIAVWA